MRDITVTCTNCDSETEVPEKHAADFEGNGDGLCKACADNQEMPPKPEPRTAYGEIMRDMRNELKEHRREVQRSAPKGSVKTVEHNPDLNRLN